MEDIYVRNEIYDIPSTSQQVTHVASAYNLLQRQGYQGNHLASCDALQDTSILCSNNLGFISLVDDIFSRLLSFSCYITRRFIFFIEDLVFRDIDRCSENRTLISSKQDSISSNRKSCKTYDIGTSSGIHQRRDSNPKDDLQLPVNTRSQLAESCYKCHGVPLIFQGTISRVKRTLRGSTDDIGWLQKSTDVPPVVDGTPRFLELLQDIRNGEHKLPNSFVYLLIPGLFSNHSPLYFVSTKTFFSKMGLACHIAKIHSESSVERNAWELKQYIEELYWGSGKRVMLLGHSKGGVDAAAALSIYWQDLKGKVAGLVLVQSPYGGTPLASDILREGQVADIETRRIMELLICKIIKGDIGALEDLTYEKRKEFLLKHRPPNDIPLISFHSEASVGPGVISTLSHIAHAELPWLPLFKFGWEHTNDDTVQAGRRVPVVIPISAAMAVCALHLQLRYGAKSDGLVTCADAEVPGSVVVKPDRKLDHAWMVYSSWKKDHSEPDACEMCEALLTQLVEIGRSNEGEL